MSLIHDALRDIGTTPPQGGATVPPPAAPLSSPAAQPAPPRAAGPRPARARTGGDWLGGVAAFGVVMAAGVAGWVFFGPGATPPAPRSATPVPAAQPAVPPPPVAAVRAPEAAAQAPVLAGASAPTVAMAAAPAPVPAPSAAVAPAAAPAVVEAAGAPAAAALAAPSAERRRAAPATARAARREAPAPAAAEPVEDKPVEQRFAEFMVAMNTQDWPAAQQQLEALRKRLPPQASGLLRAQAWYDLQRGDLDGARQGYQQLLERLPGDEEAALNLASILSRQGQADAARQLLAQAVQLRPDAPRLREALRRFTPEVRP